MWRQTNEKKIAASLCGKENRLPHEDVENHAQTKLSNQSFLNKEEEKGQAFHQTTASPPTPPKKKNSSVLITSEFPSPPFNSQNPNTICFNNDKKRVRKEILLVGDKRQKAQMSVVVVIAPFSQSSQMVVQVQIADEAKDRKRYKPIVRRLKVRRPSDARMAVAEMAMNVWAQLVMLFIKSIESVKPRAMVVVVAIVSRRT